MRIFRYLRSKDWGLVFTTLTLIVLQVWIDLRMPEYMGSITRLLETEGSPLNRIWAAGSAMFLCALGSLITGLLVGFVMAQIAASFSMRL